MLITWLFIVTYFNSRPCVRGDSIRDAFLFHQDNFNSRPCVRGDLLLRFGQVQPFLFQFTPLREGRLCGYRPTKKLGKFKFTPLREGRPATTLTKRTSAKYFNSRPCVRGDCRDRRHIRRSDISIHAPA